MPYFLGRRFRMAKIRTRTHSWCIFLGLHDNPDPRGSPGGKIRWKTYFSMVYASLRHIDTPVTHRRKISLRNSYCSENNLRFGRGKFVKRMKLDRGENGINDLAPDTIALPLSNAAFGIV